MKSKVYKREAVVLTVFLIGAMFLVPTSSITVEETKNIDVPMQSLGDGGDGEAYELDRDYYVDPEPAPMNLEDNDDAGYKRDVGNEISRSYAIYPGEMEDNWPGRGTSGKISEDDEEDWYFFAVCIGQDIEITLDPPIDFDLDLGLYNDDGDQVAFSSNSGDDQESISFTATHTEKWYMQVLYVDGLGEEQYFFDVDLVGQNDAGTSDDAGDSFAEATSISPGIYNGFLDMNDEEDWYQFNVNDGQGIHFILEMRKVAYLSDFDIYLYNPNGDLVHYESYYYDDELLYPADMSGQWRVKIDIYPGYTDIPQPTEWDYWTYGSGPYEFEFLLEASAPSPPGPIPQPDIIPVAHTFKVTNSPGSNVDEYGYLASIPACNYLDGGQRYLAPIVYTADSTPTNWYGDVDDTTDYLLEDWNDYLLSKGKNAVEYYVNSDPVKAAAEIATEAWDSSDMAVVAIDGSVYEDTARSVLYKEETLQRTTSVTDINGNSEELIPMGGFYVLPMTLGNKYGAATIEIDGTNDEPFTYGLFPHYMTMTTDWWPEHVEEKTDTYHPITTGGVWGFGVGDKSEDFDVKVTLIECDRYTINVGDSDSVITADLTTSSATDLLVFLVDPDGNLMAPDIPEWNGGVINPIHMWNGLDDPAYPPDCEDWRAWEPDLHNDFSAEVLHPQKGEWEVIVVPRYTTGSSSMSYTLNVKMRTINPTRADAAISAANAAVIASQEHIPLLYVREDSVPAETQAALTALGVTKVIFVQRGNIGSAVEASLPTIDSNLKTMQGIVDFIKDYAHTENYITITSLKTGEGFFAPSAMLAAYHCSPILRIGEADDNPGAIANKIDTWRMWNGDYYHGNRAPGHLPIYEEPITPVYGNQLFTQILRFLAGQTAELPPWGQDAKRFWNEDLHDAIKSFISGFGLDNSGQEVYGFVAPRKDIRLQAHGVMIGLNPYAGHLYGDTPSYANDIIMRNVLYPAIIFANPGRDVTTTQLMNYPDGTQWTTNDGERYSVYSSRTLKEAFMSHGRTYDGHVLWDAHLERMNEGASAFYYSGHGTGGSGMSAQYYQTDFCNYPEQIWYDAWRGYSFDNWKTARDNGFTWYNPEPANLYDIIHYKWIDQLFGNLRSNAIFYMSCSTGQQFGPTVYLDHGAVMWYGNAGSGLCPQADLLDDWFFEDALVQGLPVGEAYSKYMYLHHRDFTIGEGGEHFEEAMYGSSSLYGTEGITTIPVFFGDASLIVYSPEWTAPTPVDSPVDESNNAPPLAPTVDGPAIGNPGKEYTFTFETTDPNDDDISYYVDWGDGTFEDWDGPYSSGTGSSASHTWTEKVVHTVKVKAKDSAGLEGPWGTLEISVERTRLISLPLLERLMDRFPLLERIISIILG